MVVKGLNGKGDFKNATHLAAGADFSLAQLGDGTVWAWGSNEFGQLGAGYAMGTDADTLAVNGSNTPVQVKDGPDFPWESVATEHVLSRVASILRLWPHRPPPLLCL